MSNGSSLRLTVLNIEGNLHYARALKYLSESNSDVICLQEVLQDDIPFIKHALQMNVVSYVPLVGFNGPNNARMPEKAVWGMLFLVKAGLEVSNVKVEYYKKDNNELPIYDNDNPNCVDRAIIAGTVKKNSKEFRIITTHFTWSPNGQPTDEQERYMKKLLNLLEEEKDLILCGDTNAPRGRKIWSMLASKYNDNVPPDKKTTIDKSLHKAGDTIGDYVVDCLFSTSGYRIEDVEVKDGVSDHMAICGRIYKND